MAAVELSRKSLNYIRCGGHTFICLAASPASALDPISGQVFGISTKIYPVTLDSARAEVLGQSVRVWGSVTYSNSCVASGRNYGISMSSAQASQVDLVVSEVTTPNDYEIMCITLYSPVTIELELAELPYFADQVITVNGKVVKPVLASSEQ